MEGVSFGGILAVCGGFCEEIYVDWREELAGGAMRHLVWRGVVLFFGLGTVWAQQPPTASIVTIAVTYPHGAAVPKADVSVTLTGDRTTPDRKGTIQAGVAQFSLPQGSYDVYVEAPGCMIARQHVKIVDSGAERIALRLQQGQDCIGDGIVPVELTGSFPVVSEPLTEMIQEAPVASPVLQGRVFPGRKHRKQTPAS